MKRSLTWGSIWILLACQSPLVADESSRLLSLVTEQHKLARQSIQTMTCKYTVLTGDPNSLKVSQAGEYWRLGDSFLLQSHFPGGTDQRITIWYADAKSTALIDERASSGPRRKYATVVARRGLADDEVFGKARFVFFGPDADWIPFEDLIAKPHKLERIMNTVEQGRKLVYVDISHARARHEIWFDPSVNYLARKVIVHVPRPPGSKVKESTALVTIKAFKEVEPGIYFPERVEVQDTSDGQSSSAIRNEISFVSLVVNKAISRDLFAIRFPANIEVYDSIQDKVFLVQSGGILRELQGKKIARVGPLEVLANAGHQTTEEPLSVTRMILPFSFLVFAVGAVGLLIRRWRQSQKAA